MWFGWTEFPQLGELTLLILLAFSLTLYQTQNRLLPLMFPIDDVLLVELEQFGQQPWCVMCQTFSIHPLVQCHWGCDGGLGGRNIEMWLDEVGAVSSLFSKKLFWPVNTASLCFQALLWCGNFSIFAKTQFSPFLVWTGSNLICIQWERERRCMEKDREKR